MIEFAYVWCVYDMMRVPYEATSRRGSMRFVSVNEAEAIKYRDERVDGGVVEPEPALLLKVANALPRFVVIREPRALGEQ